MVLITIVTGAYKPTYNWGAPHCKKHIKTPFSAIPNWAIGQVPAARCPVHQWHQLPTWLPSGVGFTPSPARWVSLSSLAKDLGITWYNHVVMSENGVYHQKNSHLVGIMISKTIGCRGTLFSGKPMYNQQ